MSEDSGQPREQRLRQKSAARRAQGKQDLRRAILDAAVALFERQGYEGFSLRQVAEAIGYSPTTIYLYFRDKDDLLHHVALEGFRTFGEDLQRGAQRGEDAIGRIREIGRAYLAFGLSHPVHYRLMFMVRGEFLSRPTPPGYEPTVDSFGVLERAVLEGLKRAELAPRDPQVYTSFLWAHVHGLVALHLATPYLPRDTIEQLYEQHVEVMLNGLQT